MPATNLCRYTNEAIYLRDKSLVDELVGKTTFTEAMHFLILGRMPGKAETVILDAVLVTLMEHGLTPSATATRLVAGSAPEAIQSAVAAGLLAVASVFVGTMEPCAKLLRQIVEAKDGKAEAARIADEYRAARKPVPGFGHHLHKPDDPRTPKLFALAQEGGVPGRHIAAIKILSAEVDRAAGRHLTINATGAIAALLSEINIEPEIMRGFAVISRAAGLVAHVREEQRDPTLRAIWNAVEDAVPYAGAK
jgi:citrate synthase